MSHRFFFRSLLLPFLLSCIAGLAFSQESSSTITVGRQRGDPFSDAGNKFRGRVSDVFVFSGDGISAVQMQFALNNGDTRMGPCHGRPEGKKDLFHLDADEYIIAVSGRYESTIGSLQIHTNKRSSPIFGRNEGQEFRIEAGSGNQAVGFSGRSGRYLNSLGLTFVPLALSPAGQTSIVGGKGGALFSDSDVPLDAKISEVRVHAGDAINSIQVVYILPNGKILEGKVHGGEGGKLAVFRLDPGEYVTGISGFSSVHIDSISIRTNSRISDTFGRAGGNGIFTINVPSGNECIGFTGRSSSYLDAVGLNYTTTDKRKHPGDRSRREYR